MTLIIEKMLEMSKQSAEEKIVIFTEKAVNELNAKKEQEAAELKRIHDARTASWVEFREELKQSSSISGGFMVALEYTGCHIRLDFKNTKSKYTLLVEYSPNKKISVGELEGKNILGIKRGLSTSEARDRICEVVKYWDILINEEALERDVRADILK